MKSSTPDQKKLSRNVVGESGNQGPNSLAHVRLGRDKSIDKFAQVVLAYCKLFIPSNWRTSLRAKEGAIVKALQRLDKEAEAAKENRREDKLPDIDALRAIHKSCHKLVNVGRDKKARARVLNPRELHKDIKRVQDFLLNCAQQWGEQGGIKYSVDRGLLKLQALCARLSVCLRLYVCVCVGLCMCTSGCDASR